MAASECPVLAQQEHAEDRQVCLAHQLRNVQFAIEAGDDTLAPMMKRALLRAIAIGKRRERLEDSTLLQSRSNLFAAVRSVVDTGRHNGLSVFQAVRATLDGNPIFMPA